MFKYLSTATKSAILMELAARVESKDDAHAVVDSWVFHQIAELLESPCAEIRRSTCWMLGKLASHESTEAPVLHLKPCLKLVSLLRDKHIRVVESAIYALSQITQWMRGAEEVVRPSLKLRDCCRGLLESPDAEVQRWTCEMLGKLASHQYTLKWVLEIKPSVRLVTLLCDEAHRPKVFEATIFALSCITQSPDGAQAAIDAKILDHIPHLLESSNSQVQRWTCRTVGGLAFTNCKSMVMLGANTCVKLVSLLQEEDVQLLEEAIFALSHITRWPEGAQFSVDAKVLHYLPKLLESSIPQVRYCTCGMLARLASHESTIADVLGINPCTRLVALLRDGQVKVIESALCALGSIALSAAGAHAVIDANALDYATELLESPSPWVRTLTWKTVGKLISYEFAAGAILDLKLCDRFESLLHDEYVQAVARVRRARARRENKQDVMDEKKLEYLAELLESPDVRVREATCQALVQMESHWFKLSISVSKITVRLIALLGDTSPIVRARAFATLTGISGVLEHFSTTKESPDRDFLEILLTDRSYYGG
ncbi:armadillo-type protein [Mycena vulgaris]|nr:armadillo-type protein [Mycena vulgaris]